MPCKYINNISRWVGAFVNMKEFKGIFHVMSWNILPHHIQFSTWKIIYYKYSMTWHGIFFHVTCMICCGINNKLLTINMDLTNIAINNYIMCRFEVKRKIHICMLSFLVHSKYLGLLFNNFNIFKIVEMIRNYMFEKYLMNSN